MMLLAHLDTGIVLMVSKVGEADFEFMATTWPNHALQRTAAGRHV